MNRKSKIISKTKEIVSGDKKTIHKTKTIFIRIPSLLEEALQEALNLGLASNTSELVRLFLTEKLDKLGIIQDLIDKKKFSVEETQ